MSIQPTTEHMQKARKFLESMRDDGKLTDMEQALHAALAFGFALTARCKALEAKSTNGQRLRDGTVIRARRESDGKLVISQQCAGDQERVLLTIGGMPR